MLFHLASFLGAFLLFGLQPLVGRAVLPLFGGGSGAWMVCLLFFQLVLLGGYSAVHGLLTRSGPRWRGIYLTLAATSAGSMFLSRVSGGIPMLPGPHSPGSGFANPALGVLSVLGFSVGLPLLVLAMTSPLVQACHRKTYPDGNPYALYATSNWGSVVGLLAYPLVLEPFLGLRAQAWMVTTAFLAYLSLMLWLLRHHAPEIWEPSAKDQQEAPLTGTMSFWVWVGLAAMGTSWLMIVSNSLALSFASVPLLWVLPLLLYLATFILAFEGVRSWVQPGLWLLAGLLAMCWLLTSNTWLLGSILARPALMKITGAASGLVGLIRFIRDNPIAFGLLLPLATLFTNCLALHGRLAAQRPHPSQLSTFYLALALGGVGGGLAIGLLAPWLFHQRLEGFVLLALSGLLVLKGCRASSRIWIRPPGLMVGVSLPLLASAFCLLEVGDPQVLKARDHFGTVEISRPDPKILQLMNGNTIHGIQYVHVPLVPAGYYSEGSGLGLALRAYQAEHPTMRVGVVGLGVGSTAAYARPGDRYDFYEISQKMIDLAGLKPTVFSVLASASGEVHVHEGDGRKLLEVEAPGSFDALVIDAFAGGHIPTHLLTREAMNAYMRALSPEGLLIFHASHPLPLAFQILAQAREARLWGVWLNHNQETHVVVPSTRRQISVNFPSTYLVISRTPWPLAQKRFDPLLAGAMGPRGVPVAQAQGLHEVVRNTHKRIERVRAWTDDRNSLLPLLLAARKK